MAIKKKVIESIHSTDGLFCIDIFQRADATYGFEEFRKDFEDVGGWFAIGGYSELVFQKKKDAITAACIRVKWFSKTK